MESLNKTIVSIIIPVYNAQQYIAKCIDSVISQSYINWELILVDDGCTDKSGEICDKYAQKDKRIKVFHKKNGGVSSARNTGISEAVGEWLYFIDSDDFIDFDTLSKSIIKINTEYPDLIVHGLVNDYIYNGKSCSLPYKTFEDNDYKEIIEFTDKYGLLKGPVCKLFRQSIVKENKLFFDESICYGEDTKFTFEYLQKCKSIAFVPEHFYHYCFRIEGSLTKRSYPYLSWDNTARMLLELRLPIMKQFSMPDSYFQYIRFEYISHIIRAVYSMYKDGVSKLDRLKYLNKLHNDIYLRNPHKDLKYLNRFIYLLKVPTLMDLIMIVSIKLNKSFF